MDPRGRTGKSLLRDVINMRPLPVLQGCLEKFSNTLSTILEGQGVSLPGRLSFCWVVCSRSDPFVCLFFPVWHRQELVETMQAVKTKLQTFVKE